MRRKAYKKKEDKRKLQKLFIHEKSKHSLTLIHIRYLLRFKIHHQIGEYGKGEKKKANSGNNITLKKHNI